MSLECPDLATDFRTRAELFAVDDRSVRPVDTLSTCQD